MSETEHREVWLRRAKQLRLQLNAGVWLAWLGPTLMAYGLAVAAVALALRRLGYQPPPLGSLFCGAALLIPLTLWLMRSRWHSLREALLLLEDQVGLHNRLSAAHEGATSWPAPTPKSELLRWRWGKTLLPMALGVAALALSALVPVALMPTALTAASDPPLALQETQAWLEELSREEVMDEEKIDEWKQKLEGLMSQPAEQWYTHASLEAGDDLRDQLSDSLRRMNHDLMAVRAQLDAWQQELQQSSPGSAGMELSPELQKALERLNNGGLQLSPEMLKNLGALDPSKLQHLSPEQLRQLASQCQSALKACKACLGEGKGEGKGEGEGQGKGQSELAALQALGLEPGRGGVTRGPGSAPLFLEESATDLRTRSSAGIESTDFERAALGESIAERQGEHEVDTRAYTGPGRAGSIQSQGSGGENVWRQQLMPDEKKTLQKFYQ